MHPTTRDKPSVVLDCGVCSSLENRIVCLMSVRCEVGVTDTARYARLRVSTACRVTGVDLRDEPDVNDRLLFLGLDFEASALSRRELERLAAASENDAFADEPWLLLATSLVPENSSTFKGSCGDECVMKYRGIAFAS